MPGLKPSLAAVHFDQWFRGTRVLGALGGMPHQWLAPSEKPCQMLLRLQVMLLTSAEMSETAM